MFVIILFSTAVFLWALYKYIEYCNFIKKLDIFPQIKGWPLLGVALEFTDPDNGLSYPLKCFQNLGSSFVTYLGPWPALMVCDPDLAETILSSNVQIDKSKTYELFHNWFGDGLLTSTGDKWRSHRKVLTPSFHYTILEEFVQTFDKASKVLVAKLNKEVENTSVDVFKYLTLCTLDIICETAMGTTINVQNNKNVKIVESFKEMCHLLYERCMAPHYHINWIYRLTNAYKREQKALKVLRNFSETIIRNRREYLEQKGTLDTIDDCGTKRKHSFLDVLLQANVNGRKLTDQEIREEVDTFIFEGHDTTAIALSFAVYLLSKHQDVQKKVYDEILSVIGPDKNKSVRMNDLNQLKYTEMFIKESLRLYPSVPAYSRCTNADIPWKGGIIPKGLEIVIHSYIQHRNPDIFPNPEKFDPERFSPENTLKRHPFAYVPFSAGPRNCIGQKFAMLEMKATISKILRFFEVMPATPYHEVKVMAKVTIQSSSGIRVGLRPRD